MNNAWENLNKTWKERLEKLEDAMQAAVQYQDTLQVRGWGMPTKEIHVLCFLLSFLNLVRDDSPSVLRCFET